MNRVWTSLLDLRRHLCFLSVLKPVDTSQKSRNPLVLSEGVKFRGEWVAKKKIESRFLIHERCSPGFVSIESMSDPKFPRDNNKSFYALHSTQCSISRNRIMFYLTEANITETIYSLDESSCLLTAHIGVSNYRHWTLLPTLDSPAANDPNNAVENQSLSAVLPIQPTFTHITAVH